MAETKTTNEAETAGATAASGEATEAKPRRRITRRKAVEAHVRSYFDALGARDPSAMVEHWSEDGVADIVPVGVLRGHAEIAAMFRELFAALPDLETTVTRLVTGEREAAVEWRMTGHFTGEPMQGVDPTGRRVDFRGVDYIELDGGKIVKVTAYYDSMEFARQIGLMPPRESGAERAMKTAFNTGTKLKRAIAERRTGR